MSRNMRPPCGDVVLHTEGIQKRFKNSITVGPLSFSVRAGEVYAIVGPNGSGKTTTLRIVVGIYKPDSGHVHVCGRALEARRGSMGLVAYVPEETAVYPRLTGYEHLLFYATLYTGSRRKARYIADQAAEISDLGDDLRRRVEEYSKGMRRRLLVSLALALETPLIVLDEPTSGLDVFSAVRIRRLIKEATKSGRAVVLASHNMLEVEELADRVALMYRGKFVDEGDPGTLLKRYEAENLEEAFVKAIQQGEGSVHGR